MAKSDSVIAPRHDDDNFPFRIVPKKTGDVLSEKQLLDYRNKRRKFIQWLLNIGKDPDTAEGYPVGTARRTASRVNYWERQVWEQENQYIPLPSRDHAEAHMDDLAYSDYSASHKKKVQYALKRYFRWRGYEYDHEVWEPERTFSTSTSSTPRDFLTIDERQQIRQEALEYGWLPQYGSYSPEGRSRMKPYIAERLDKPVSSLSKEDWKDVSSWKFTSLVWVSLDAGLRPVEVGRAKTDWVDSDQGVLRIPAEDSSKGRQHWTVSLRSDTADALAEWLRERSHRPKYDETNALWLTRRGNPYASKSLGRLLRTLCDHAGIEHEHRSMTWYTIRHSVGTYMVREEDLAAAQTQLRHTSPKTTLRYDQAPVEDRKDALDRIG